MFIGHYAVALAAKRAAPRASLGALVAAASALDLLWPLFVLAGWEWYATVPADSPFLHFRFDHYPWSHSLLAAFVWATLAAALYQWKTRDGNGALVVWLLVVSHWVLDAVSHRPDLPVTPRSIVRVGLAVWENPVLTVAVEAALLGAGAWLYRSATRPRDRIGSAGFAAYVAFLVLVYVWSILAPPGPGMSPAAVATGGLGFGFLLVAAAWWMDRHRRTD